MADTFDIAIIGAGIAGASIAAELSATARVILLEMERQPGYHTTGRSAAVFAPTYGPAAIRALTRASEAFFTSAPEPFFDTPLLSPRSIMMLAGQDQSAQLAKMQQEIGAETDVQMLDAAQTEAANPLLRKGYAAGAMWDSNARDIDVHALHHGMLRRFRENGGRLVTNAKVTQAKRSGDHWALTAGGKTWQAQIVVNAAGAWVDDVGERFGVEPIGIWPMRRTALIVQAPDGFDVDALPLTVDVEEKFYVKPDAGRLLISPANEDLSPPCDVQPTEMDIAICVDRIETAFALTVGRIENKWAGLRSFAADKCPVFGFDPKIAGFYWAAGQGGYGIQTAPALARLAAAQIEGRAIPADILGQGVTARDLAPERFGATL